MSKMLKLISFDSVSICFLFLSILGQLYLLLLPKNTLHSILLFLAASIIGP